MSDRPGSSSAESVPSELDNDETFDGFSVVSEEDFDDSVREQIEQERREQEFAASVAYREQLLATHVSFNNRSEFAPGDLVHWKPGLQNKTYPYPESVGVVIELLPEPMFVKDRDAGSQYYMEPLDIAIAVLVGEEKQFAVYWFDSRRFAKAEPSQD